MERSPSEWKAILETQSIDEKTFKRLFDQLYKNYDEKCQEILRINIERSELLDIISLAKNRFKVTYVTKQSNINIQQEPEIEEDIPKVEHKIQDELIKEKPKVKNSKSKKVEIQEDLKSVIQEDLKSVIPEALIEETTTTKRSKSKKNLKK